MTSTGLYYFIIPLNPIHSAFLVTCAAHKIDILCMLVCELCVWRNGGIREVGGITRQKVTCIWLLLDFAETILA